MEAATEMVIKRATEDSTKQGRVEEEVVHVKLRRLQLYLIGEDRPR